MARIEWSADFSVNVQALDDQHRNLVEIVNKLEHARRKARGSRVMDQILNDLLGYTQEHFAFEEKLMTEAGYAGLPEHQSRHRQLLQKLERYQYEYTSEGRRITVDMKEFLHYWLTEHILKHDKAYSECLVEHLAAAAPASGKR